MELYLTKTKNQYEKRHQKQMKTALRVERETEQEREINAVSKMLGSSIKDISTQKFSIWSNMLCTKNPYGSSNALKLDAV